MERNHKNTDCYFFYYSTCTKGDSCAYRHEPSALGSETVCQYWQQGSCHNQHCNYRHMEIKKNRKIIPCYWEKFPAGCKKPHCPFLHKQTRNNISNPIEPVKPGATPVKPGNQEWTNRPDGKFDGNSGETEQPGRGNSEASSFIGSPVVDPLIVNFEEESDNDSASSKILTSSKLPQNRLSFHKTHEQIKLQEMAEEADFYSYSVYQNTDGGGKIKSDVTVKEEPAKALNFQILSLDEIRKRKRNRIAEKKTVEDSEKGESLTEIVKALDHLRDVHASSSNTDEFPSESSYKRKISTEETDTFKSEGHLQKKIRVMDPEVSPKVAPIRLKRTRRVSPPIPEQSNATAEDKQPKNLTNKLSIARNIVEIRDCDSSTDDPEQDTLVLDTSSSLLVNDLEVLSNKSNLSTDAIIKTSRQELGNLTSGSDDILKDIDDLLTDDISL